ncbi:MAG: ABC transporter permease, partial [Hyphomicrobiaceae bacterium]
MQGEGIEARLKRWWFVGGEPRLGAFDLGLIAGFVALLLAGAWFAEAFFTERNMSNLMRQVVANGLISLGMLLVIPTGGIDLSVGSVVALGGVLFAGIADRLGVALAVANGAAAGLINGFVVARFKLQSFIVTLATMGVVRGCVYLYTEIPLSPSHPGFRDLGATLVGPVPL